MFIKSGLNVPITSINTNDWNSIFNDLLLKNKDYFGETIECQFYELIGKNLVLPTFYKLSNNYNNILDNRIIGDSIPINILPHFKPRDTIQKEAIEFVNKNNNSIIILPPGKGKTVIGSVCTAINKRVTCILVHKLDLKQQWIDSILNFTNVDVKNIISIDDIFKKDFKNENKYIIIDTIQSILAKIRKHGSKSIAAKFDMLKIGYLIFDEIHLTVGPEMFTKIMYCFNAKKTTGFTATLSRNSDKSTNLIYYWLGENIYKNLQYDLIPTIYKIQFNTPWSETEDTPHMKKKKGGNYSKIFNVYPKFGQFNKNTYLQLLLNHEDYNIMLCDYIKKSFDSGRKTLLLTLRVEHIENLYKMLTEKYNFADFEVGRCCSNYSLDELQKDIVLATYHKCSTGTNVPTIDTIFLATPTLASSPNSLETELEQSIGRILREHGDKKKPIVIDFVDMTFNYTKKLFETRERFYKRKEFKCEWK